ncbi:MAG: putative toxin-antitoxin system toxin component, PIN family [Planctomycetales bacterium]|nr:putative toxin-antitoxin system toxin component, PIN family [Planctomycetales bacterium]
MSDPRLVFDTNVVVSAVLFLATVPARALELGQAVGRLLVSDETVEELRRVLMRTKFDRYVRSDERARFLGRVLDDAMLVEIIESIDDCRDPNDNKFLELAVSGDATHLVTGDDDLLVLHPFRGVAIVTPQAFLDEFSPPR